MTNVPGHNRVEQLVLRHEPIAVLDEMDEHVERLWLQRDGLAAAGGRHAAGVHAHVSELVDFALRHRILNTPGNTITATSQRRHDAEAIPEASSRWGCARA